MTSKLFAIPFIALMAIGTVVTAQDNKKFESQKDQAIDQYQMQKKTAQTTFKRDMDALNDQKNLTPEQKQVRKKQIIATYQQQKKANQETFEQNKEARKTIKKSEKEVEKNEKEIERNDDNKKHKMKEKYEGRSKEHHNNKANDHQKNKPNINHKPRH